MGKPRKRGKSLLTVMLALSAASILVAGGLMISVAERSLRSFQTYLEESQKQETNAAASMLNRDLDSLQTLMYRYLADDDLLRIKLYINDNTANMQYLQSVKTIRAMLQSVETTLTLVEGVSIYFPEYQRVITSASASAYTDEVKTWVARVLEREEKAAFVEEGQLYFAIANDIGVGAYGSGVLVVSRTPEYVGARYMRRFAQESSADQFALFVRSEGELGLFTSSHSLFDGLTAQRLSALMGDSDEGGAILEGGKTRYLLTWKRTALSALQVCQITPMERLDRQLREYRNMMVFGYSLALLVIALLVCVMYRMIKTPIGRIGKAMRHFETGDFSVRIEPAWSAEFQRMFDQFNRMAAHTQRYIEQEYELRLLHSKAELKQMQYQISPHFLYNTYFTLRAMLLDEEYEQAEQLAGIMGRYLRYITTSHHEYATLREEIDHAAAYLQIQQIRFGSRVEARIEECPAAEMALQVPKLILQPLIENAFEHGVKHQAGKSLVRVRFLRTAEEICIRVEDSGENTPDAMIQRAQEMLEQGASGPENDSVALVNIHKRLCMAYQNGSRLRVSRSELGGFCSEICIVRGEADVSDADRG